MDKIPVGILGATGVVGQQYVQLLSKHPWFEITFLAASQHSAHRTYAEAVQGRWRQSQPLPEYVGNQIVLPLDSVDKARKTCKLVFSAVGSDIAAQFEHRYAEAGLAVVSNASHHRRDPDIPVVIPEINASHLEIIPKQQQRRGWSLGFIVAKPNCSLQSYLLPLWPLLQSYGIQKLIVSTLQAVSGAGYPGISALQIADNVIPYIAGEEEKSEWEPLKIFGHVANDMIVNAESIAISSHCNRVPVTDGHMSCVSVALNSKPAHLDEIVALWSAFEGQPQTLGLPSAPSKPIVYAEASDRPQTRLDRNAGNGMAITVGRLRPCPVLDIRFVGLSHNAIRGAAGGGVLIAELLVKQHYLNE